MCPVALPAAHHFATHLALKYYLPNTIFYFKLDHLGDVLAIRGIVQLGILKYTRE